MDEWDWNIAVFCQNEQSAIADCLQDIERASVGQRVLVCVILNGSNDGSEAHAVQAARASSLDVLIVRVAAGDKSNAINLFNYALRVPAKAYMYADGYVRISQPSLKNLAETLDAVPHAHATTAVCSNGRSMQLATQETLEVGGRLHGQLHAFRPGFVDAMVSRGIRLPIGLYRGDGLLGTFTAYDLDPLQNSWDNSRIKGVAGAQYQIRPLSLSSPRDVLRQFRRMIRQARGRLEVLAIKDIIETKGFEHLPGNADDMLVSYLAAHGRPAVSKAMWPFLMLAVRELSTARPFPPGSLHGQVVHASRATIVDSVLAPHELLRQASPHVAIQSHA